MSDFSDWVQQEIAERISSASIETYGSFLVKANNAFSKDYDALAQGTSGQILISAGASALPVWSDPSFDINGLDVDTIAAADTIAFYDDTAGSNKKTTFTGFESTLNHDNLVNGDHWIPGSSDLYMADNSIQGVITMYVDELSNNNNSNISVITELYLNGNNIVDVGSLEVTYGDVTLGSGNVLIENGYIATNNIQAYSGSVITINSNLTTTGTITSGDITISSPTPILVLQDSNSLGAASVGYIEWRDSGGGRAGFLGNNTSGNDDLYWKNEQGGNIVIETTGAGELQIFANIDAQDNNITTTGTIDGINVTSGEDPGHTHTGTSLSSIDISDDTNLAGGSGITLNDDTIDLDINGLNVDTIAAADTLAFYDATGAHNNKITFANFESTLDHDTIISGTIANHDTSATGSQLDTLTDNSIANALHRHSELVASDGSPDPALKIDADGNVGINTSSPTAQLTIKNNGIDTAPLGSELLTNGDFDSDLSSWTAGANWAWASGTAEHSSGSVETLYQGVSLTNGQTYHITFTTSNVTAGAVVVTFGALVGSYGITGNSTYDYTFKATSTSSFDLTFTPGSTWNGRLDDVSVKQITDVSNVLMYLENSTTEGVDFRASGAGQNIFIGRQVGRYNTTGYYNFAIGMYAFRSNTTGFYNSALGRFALESNTTGNYNTAIGSFALNSSVIATYNTAIGTFALNSTTTGGSNTAIGPSVLYSNTTGYHNTAIGMFALNNNDTGNRNMAIGSYSLLANSSGLGSTAIGFRALDTVTTGDYNIGIGFFTGSGITTGHHNTIIGSNMGGLASGLIGHVIIADGYGTHRLVVDDSGNVKLGDGGTTDYMNIDVTGVVTFKGSGGLVIGSMYIPGTDIEVLIGGASPVEVKNTTDDGWVAGELNGVTFPTGGTEHYLTISEAGKYEVIWNMSVHTNLGGAQELHGGVMVDSVAIRNNGEAQRTVANANDTANMGSSCIIDCPNGTEEISLWVTNSASNDIHVVHATVTIKLIAGT